MKIRLVMLGRTVVYLHISTLLYAGYMVAIDQGMLMLIAMSSVIMHEAAHCASAWVIGSTPYEIEILPMGAMMRMEESAEIQRGWKMIIYLAGPVMTLLLCWAGIVCGKCQLLPMKVCRSIFNCNLALLCLNMLPAMPLDGGNLLMLLLQPWIRGERLRTMMRLISTVIGLCCIAGNMWLTWNMGGWNLSLACAGCFMIYAGTVATRTNALHQLRSMLDRKIRLEKKQSAAMHCVVVWSSCTLRKALLSLHPRKYTQLWIIGSNMQHLGVITETKLMECYMNTPGRCIGEIVCKSANIA